MKSIFNLSILTIEKGLRASISFFISLLIINSFSQIEYGQFSFILAIFNIITSVSNIGLRNVYLRYISNKVPQQEILQIKYTAASFLFIIPFFLIVLLGIVYWFGVIGFTSFAILTVMVIPFFLQFNDLIELEEISGGRYLKPVGLKFLGFLISSLLKIVFILYFTKIHWILFLIGFEFFLGWLLIFISKKGFYRGFSFKFVKASRIKGLFKEGLPFVFNSLFIIIYMRIDQVMLKLLEGSVSLANYSASVKIVEIFGLLGVVINYYYSPIFLKIGNENEFYLKMKKLIINSLIISCIPIVLFQLLPNKFYAIILSQDYYGIKQYISILSFSIMLSYAGLIRSIYIVKFNREKFQLISVSLGALINVMLNFLLIPKLGINGCIYATLFSYFVVVHLSNFIFKKDRLIGALLLMPFLNIKKLIEKTR